MVCSSGKPLLYCCTLHWHTLRQDNLNGEPGEFELQQIPVVARSNLAEGVQHDAKAFLIFSGSNERAVVAFCRRLKKHNLDIYIIARNERDAIFRTRFGKNVVATRATDLLDLADLDRCISIAHVKCNAEEFVIAPTSEFFDIFLLENPDFFRERRCTIPLVDLALYRLVSDKASFSRLCSEHGIPTPARRLQASSNYPFVAKPLQNVTFGKRSLYPWLIHNQSDWDEFANKENPDDYYFEEFVLGASYYLLMYLSPTGETTLFSQRNLIQQPRGKSILLAESASLHKEPIARQCVELLRHLGFWGLAMIEIMKSNEEYVLIELNPRFWGPFQLLNNARNRILDRFIEDSLETALAANADASRDASYLWSGGILGVYASGGTPVWHFPKPRNWLLHIARKLRSDVYLHRDTLGYFFWEHITAIREIISRRKQS